MYKIFFILIVLSFYSFSSIAQIDNIGNYHINKNAFHNPDDTISISVEIKKNGVTNSEPVKNKIRCKVVFRSSQYIRNQEKIEDIFDFELTYKDRIDDSYIYTISIPVIILKEGRYNINVLCTDDNWNNITSMENFGYFPEPISIGETGFVRILSDFKINNDLFKYSLMDFSNRYNLLPEYLEGIYSKGFCSNELIELDNIIVQFWTLKTSQQGEIKGYYSLDNQEFECIENIELIDNSTDGILKFDNFQNKYSFYLNDDIIDYSFNLKSGLQDIINLIDNQETGKHNIRFYFTLENDKTVRFPQNGFINTSFVVANTPQGADCQAELLPINLLSFDVIKKEKNVHIKWVTVSEINNDLFEIQKSTNTIDWQKIATIEGKGNTNTQNIYEHTDKFPFPDESYYRLIQIDFNGNFKYSKVKVIYNFENKLKIYPNPASNYLYYTITDKNKEFDVTIFNTNGQRIKSFILPDKNRSDYKIDISNLKKGTYFIKYINKQTHQVKINTFIKI